MSQLTSHLTAIDQIFQKQADEITSLREELKACKEELWSTKGEFSQRLARLEASVLYNQPKPQVTEAEVEAFFKVLKQEPAEEPTEVPTPTDDEVEAAVVDEMILEAELGALIHQLEVDAADYFNPGTQSLREFAEKSKAEFAKINEGKPAEVVEFGEQLSQKFQEFYEMADRLTGGKMRIPTDICRAPAAS